MNDIVAFNVIQRDTLAMLSDDALESEADRFVEKLQRNISRAFTHEILSVRSVLKTDIQNSNDNPRTSQVANS